MVVFNLTLEMFTCRFDDDNKGLDYVMIFINMISVLLEIFMVVFKNCMFYIIAIGWCITTFDLVA